MAKTINITTDFITLGQLLKYINIVSDGGAVKWYLANNNIIVDGEVEKRRGRKLYYGSKIIIKDKIYIIGKN